jgi:hypothetical protein
MTEREDFWLHLIVMTMQGIMVFTTLLTVLFLVDSG